MPTARSGTSATLVTPAAPEEAFDADTANPGEVEKAKSSQRESKTGKYGSQPVQPYSPPETQEELQQKTHWVEIVLVDEAGKPVPGRKYRIELPDQTVKVGTLDADGSAHVNGIDPGTCKVTFPDLDEEAWVRQ